MFSVVMLNVFSCVEKGALTLASHSALTAVLAMATVCTPFQSVEEVADVVAVLPTPQIGQTRLSVEAVAVISGCLQQNNLFQCLLNTAIYRWGKQPRLDCSVVRSQIRLRLVVNVETSGQLAGLVQLEALH